jgi:transcriptional regulator with XRE-family HTH domain
MTIENKLKNLILKYYKSIREFSIKANISYSTLDSIFKRGIGNANISNVLKICNALGISADALGENEIVFVIEKKEEYVPNEVNLLIPFRKLADAGQKEVIKYAQLIASSPEYKNSQSVTMALDA